MNTDSLVQQIPTDVVEGMSKFLLGEEIFHKAIELITILDTQDLPNHIKKQAVIDDLQYLAVGILKAFLAIGIDLAVQWLRQASAESRSND